MREHNRIANILQTMNPQWNDERTYLTARRITIAIWQHIIYNEFVPRTLGWNAVNLYGLNLLTEGYFEGKIQLVKLKFQKALCATIECKGLVFSCLCFSSSFFL